MVMKMNTQSQSNKYKSRYADEKQKELYKKFPSNHFLSNENNLDHFLLWNTFFKRNLHRVATDYLGLKLHLYQILILYLMGISRFIAIIASRSAAKSFIIAIYACCVCIVKPGSKVVLSSATKGQSKLIISEKIRNELMTKSGMLRKEIRSIKDNQNEVIVFFRNTSTITVVPASENGRGYRSTCIIREEFRQIDKHIEDSVLAPFQIIRTPAYMLDAYYSNIPELQEESVDVYISSSWLDNGHWMWKIVDQAYDGMMNDLDMCLLAFDESITLKHKIKSMTYMQNEKKKQDPLTWRIEFLNERVKEDTSAYFTYSMLHKNQRAKRAFYPRKTVDARLNKKNPYDIPKQAGEVRVVACDMAFVENKRNDNSIFSCIRGLPEYSTYNSEKSGVINVSNGYRRIVSYMESVQGGDTFKQALRIRQLFEDFHADYIVLDMRNAGISVYDLLARVMYDDERDCEYSPLLCMNDEKIASRVKADGAIPCVFAVVATPKLNSDIAKDFRQILDGEMIDLLISFEQANEEILSNITEYVNSPDADTQFFFEAPFLETHALISETTALLYEKSPQTDIITIKERGANRKDRYTSCSYGSYFFSILGQDLLSNSDEYEFEVFIN